MRRAAIYNREGKYIVHAYSETTAGVWMVCPPIFAVVDAAGPTEVGQKVLSSLAGSRSGVLHPSNWKAVLKRLLAAAGVSSWATFCSHASCVEIEEVEGQVALIPTQNLGAAGGFRPEPTMQVLATRADPTQIGTLAAALLSSRD